jgi:hypothetical protein
MKYQRVVVTRHGGPEVLQTMEDDLPEPRAGEARAKVLAAGVSGHDLSIFARHGSIGFRPRWSTPRDDDRETPDGKRADDGCPPESRYRFGGHLLSRAFRPMAPETGSGDDDHVGPMGQAVQTSRSQQRAAK